jgi:hypothetical protein
VYQDRLTRAEDLLGAPDLTRRIRTFPDPI